MLLVYLTDQDHQVHENFNARCGGVALRALSVLSRSTVSVPDFDRKYSRCCSFISAQIILRRLNTTVWHSSASDSPLLDVFDWL